MRNKYYNYSIGQLKEERTFIFYQLNHNELSDEQHNEIFDTLNAINEALIHKTKEEDNDVF